MMTNGFPSSRNCPPRISNDLAAAGRGALALTGAGEDCGVEVAPDAMVGNGHIDEANRTAVQSNLLGIVTILIQVCRRQIVAHL